MTCLLKEKIKMCVVLATAFLAINPASAGDDLKKGADVYNGTCVACHGENGKGEIPGVPDFTSIKGPLTKKDAVLFDNILNGFESPGSDMAMPELGGNEDLTEQDIKNVIAYIRVTFQRKK